MRRIRLESVIFIIGFCAFGAGLWMVYPPLCLAACGGILMRISMPGGDK